MDTGLRTRTDARWPVIVGLVAAVYCALNLALPRLPIHGVIASYVIPPALWGIVICVILRLPRYTVAGKLKTRSTIIQLALMIGFLQVALYAIGGLFTVFGKSPSSFAPLGVLSNLALVGSMLMGMELSRAWLINHLGKHILLGTASVALLFTVAGLPFTQIAGLKPEVSSLAFVNSTLLPSLAENLLASLLALLAGPAASIAYRGVLQAFWTFSPVLPDLSWSLLGFIGTTLPIIGLVAVWKFYASQTQRARARQSNGGLRAGWIATAMLSVAIVWFSVGLFPIHPALVGSGSMSPTLDVGDIALIAKTSGSTIKIGDVIEFRTPEKVHIIHRVVALQEQGGTKVLITKGDANSTPDSAPVLFENVVGKLIFNTHRVGWAAVVIKRFLVPQR